MKADTLSAAPIERIRSNLVGLRMPRALETLGHIVQQLERGQISAIEAIDMLLAEEITVRETRRIKAALQMARLATIKTLSGFDFSFQPSLDRNRVLALAQLDFIDRHEVVHFIGQSGTGKSHLAAALGVEAVRAGRSVYFSPLADILDSLARADGADGRPRAAMVKLRTQPFVRPTGGGLGLSGRPSSRQVPTATARRSGQGMKPLAARARRASLDGSEHRGSPSVLVGSVWQRSGEFYSGTSGEISTGIDRAQRDAILRPEIRRGRGENLQGYGVCKGWRQLRRG